jgi:hypothetical protein
VPPYGRLEDVKLCGKADGESFDVVAPWEPAGWEECVIGTAYENVLGRWHWNIGNHGSQDGSFTGWPKVKGAVEGLLTHMMDCEEHQEEDIQASEW